MEILNEQNRAEYEQFLRTHPKGNFAQSPEWARVKTAWQSEAVIVRDTEGRIKGTASVLIRRMPLLHYGLAGLHTAAAAPSVTSTTPRHCTNSSPI